MSRSPAARRNDANDPQETWAAQGFRSAKALFVFRISVISSPPLHGHDPLGRVTWQSTLDGENS